MAPLEIRSFPEISPVRLPLLPPMCFLVESSTSTWRMKEISYHLSLEFRVGLVVIQRT